MRRPGRTAWIVAAVGASSLLAPGAVAQDVVCARIARVDGPTAPLWDAELRRFATGAGIRVAVIDTGVSASPELDQLVAGGDFVTPDAPDPLFDCDAHGTVVAGIIAGTTAGVAPDAEVISIRQTSAHYRSRELDPTAGAGSVRTLVDALNNALDLQADVINISVVSCLDPRVSPRVDTSGLDAALARAEAEGAVVVAAAGNVTSQCPQGSSVIPSHSPTVLAVGARSDAHQLAEYSVAVPESSAQLSAPGDVTVGLSPDGRGWAAGTLDAQGNVSPFEGTSFAAPVVAGSIALLRQRHPDLSPAEVRALVAASAQPHGGAIDPLSVVTQLRQETPTQDHTVVVSAARQHTSAAAARWRSVVTALAAVLLLAVVGAAIRRPH
ncbi:S8 family serine peptidase [Corynebacterium lipophiloflavum]|uniref:Type VII secretion-associated serine protease mycosin n=1 Tax=Corynebacterium lipophiloflavum (strain ATCC 700352 / DSM 44291 / CCUG 37336 / JCM 10383 / DMMZ 1944) TaxID=525263 RepID=C0XUR9_CORLD|nr:S8 family serine peptidase [Corynebacterium lipophiloflavum]EEI16094.1 putative type VII secretion-associated serine protease mycosin [Corynebacterium lipophiloflavum DSM 44291]